MIAVHLVVAGMQTEWATAVVEMSVSRLAGVARVFGVKSLGICSVMFDETMANVDEILRAVSEAGFQAQVYRPRPALSAG